MDLTAYKKSGPIYENVCWLLKHYREFKYYNISRDVYEFNTQVMKRDDEIFSINDVISFVENEESCKRRAENIWSHNGCEYVDYLVKIMEKNIEKMCGTRGKLNKKGNLIKEYFMVNTSAKEIKSSNFYTFLHSAISSYSYHFIQLLKDDEKAFSKVKTDEDANEEINLIKETMSMHSHGGMCYKDTVKLLKNYKKLKFIGVQKRIGESSQMIREYLGIKEEDNEYLKALDRIEYVDLPDNMKSWMYSSMIETTNAYISFVDEAFRRMGWLGEKGKEYQKIIDMSFMNPRMSKLTWKEKVERVGLTQRKFYDKRIRGIEMLSKILWGILAHRHDMSPFYGNRKGF